MNQYRTTCGSSFSLKTIMVTVMFILQWGRQSTAKEVTADTRVNSGKWPYNDPLIPVNRPFLTFNDHIPGNQPSFGPKLPSQSWLLFNTFSSLAERSYSQAVRIKSVMSRSKDKSQEFTLSRLPRTWSGRSLSLRPW